MARWAAVLAVLAAALALAFAVGDHSSVTFEPTIPKYHVRKPAFTAGRSTHADIPQPLYTAVQFFKSWTPNVEFVVKDYYTTKKSGVTHVYLRQLVNGIEVANGDANINIDKRGAITSAHHSFFLGESFGINAVPRVTPADAARALATFVNRRAGDIRAVHVGGTQNRPRGHGIAAQQLPRAPPAHAQCALLGRNLCARVSPQRMAARRS